jgi:hypothetical protein
MQTQPIEKMVIHRGHRVGNMATHAAAEMVILRVAEVLSRDATRNPHTREAHTAYVSGAIGMAISLGVLTEDRAMQLRKACGLMMTGATIPEPGAVAIDPDYARIIVAVRRNAGATLTTPVELADIGTTAAQDMLTRLQADGIIGEADMLGFYPLRAGEV